MSLRRQHLSFAFVPPSGRQVVVRRVIHDNLATDNEAAEVGAAVVESGRAAVRQLGIRLGGVDVITTDPSRPLDATGGVILEVNTTPGFYYHYRCVGDRGDVAIPILAALLDLSSGPRARPLGLGGRSRPTR